MLITGERQIAPSLDGIRRDHVARYEWAAKVIPERSRVVDFACGVGYGTQVLADAGHNATGFDRSAEAIAYGRKFYPRAEYRLADGRCPLKSFDVGVCFETIEHVEDPRDLLDSLRGGKLLLASVPNEDVIPFGPGFSYHYRHYTKREFEQLLNDCGWRVREWWGQAGDESDVERDLEGRTLIAIAERAGDRPKAETPEPIRTVEQVPTEAVDSYAPEHVTILGLGPSLERYVDMAKRLGGKHAYSDEVWGINAVAGVIMCDRVFHMDDVRIQEARAKELPESNIARMLEWLRFHPGPIVTSRAHPDYPGLVEFPLQDVINELHHPYFNSTAAYAIAYAIYIGVKKISLFGIDFTYPNAHHAEKGRACVEFWLGIASARGIQIRIPKESTLMDAIHSQEERLYGYDTLDVTIRSVENGIEIDFVEKEAIPTALEIEDRYDHSRHPNTLMSSQ